MLIDPEILEKQTLQTKLISSNTEVGPAAEDATSLAITPFTVGSKNAWATVLISSGLHNSPTPLFLMEFRAFSTYSSSSFLLLLTAWLGAASLNAWTNYYKYTLRLTPEFGLALQQGSSQDHPRTAGTLYFSPPDYTDKSGSCLRYAIHAEEANGSAKGDSGELCVTEDLRDKLTSGDFRRLSTADSSALKSAIKKSYPQHKPKLQPDRPFIPGTRIDAWFFLKCVCSTFPTAAAGALLGYTITSGSKKIPAAVLLALMNWCKNLFLDMPVVAAAYGVSPEQGNLAPLIEQPGAWWVLNTLVLGFLKNIAPCLSSLLVASGALTLTPIIPLNVLMALTLFVYAESTFLIFMLYVLKNLNIQKTVTEHEAPNSWYTRIRNHIFSTNAVATMLPVLHNSFAVELPFSCEQPTWDQASAWRQSAAWVMGELLGFRATTVSLPLSLGVSAQTVAHSLATMSALSNLVLLYQPTTQVAQTFLQYFWGNTVTPLTALAVTVCLFALEGYGAIMSARSQWPNFHAYVNIREQELKRNRPHAYAALPTFSHSPGI